MTAVHQALPTFAAHDAIGLHVLRLRRILRDAGFESEIFADDIHPPVRHEARPAHELVARRASEGWVIYHASTGSPLGARIVEQGWRLIVDYHNITDARFYDRWAPAIAAQMRDARAQVAAIAPPCRLALADSPFNESELVALGFSPTAVAPILIDFTDYDIAPDDRARDRRTRRSGTNWFFVGRVAPNKCQHDIVAAFAVYRRLFDPDARLTLVGGISAPLYWRALEGLVAELDLTDSVTLLPGASLPELVAHYRAADVLVCLSEHEGFCVPVLEAMYFDVPVVAFASTAVPATVGDAAVLLADKDPVTVAVAIDRVMGDDGLRARLAAAGQRRVDTFALPRTSQVMLDAVRRVVEGTPARA